MRPLDNVLKGIGLLVGPVVLEFDPAEHNLRRWSCRVVPSAGGPVVEALAGTAHQAAERLTRKLKAYR